MWVFKFDGCWYWVDFVISVGCVGLGDGGGGVFFCFYVGGGCVGVVCCVFWFVWWVFVWCRCVVCVGCGLCCGMLDLVCRSIDCGWFGWVDGRCRCNCYWLGVFGVCVWFFVLF